MRFKRRYVKIGICIFIFLFLLGVSNRFLLPVYNRVGKQIQKTVETFKLSVKDKTGLVISYKSLSPSVLSGISINGITLLDSESGKQVAYIGRLSLGYALKAIFAKDFKAGAKSLVLRDVEICVERGENDFWLRRFERKSGGGEEEKAALALEGDSDSAVKKFFESLDLDFRLRLTFQRPS